MKPLVSILIPAYNAEQWIAETLRSAVAQTWARKEIIVVDDGSRDKTAAIASSFEPQGVRVFKQSNQGAAAARNRALALSKGDYIQWLDADDLLAPDKIARQLENPAHSKTLLSSPWGRFMHRPRRAKFIHTALWNDLSPVEWLLAKMGQNLYMQTACWLVSRELSDAAGPWNEKLLGDDDGEYFCRVLLASDGVQFVPDANVYYRISGRTLSYIGRSQTKVDAHWRSMRMHLDYLQSLEQSERVRAACVAYLRASLLVFYPERLDIVEQAERIAADFGFVLGPPSLERKYEWLRRVFGWHAAKTVRLFLPRTRWSLTESWDKMLSRFEPVSEGA
jgi:glycosyltransferase involved in cell wall biosynthesis